jgi:hypothetical protein
VLTLDNSLQPQRVILSTGFTATLTFTFSLASNTKKHCDAGEKIYLRISTDLRVLSVPRYEKVVLGAAGWILFTANINSTSVTGRCPVTLNILAAKTGAQKHKKAIFLKRAGKVVPVLN